MLLNFDVRKTPHTRLLIGISIGKTLTSCQNISLVSGHCLKFVKLWRFIWIFFFQQKYIFRETKVRCVSGEIRPSSLIVLHCQHVWCFFHASQKSFCQHGRVFLHCANASFPVNSKLKARAAAPSHLFSHDPTRLDIM